MWFGKCSFGKMSVRGNAIRWTVHRENIRPRNCLFRELPLRELSVGRISSGNCTSGKSPSGKCSSGKFPSGNCPRTISLLVHKIWKYYLRDGKKQDQICTQNVPQSVILSMQILNNFLEMTLVKVWHVSQKLAHCKSSLNLTQQKIFSFPSMIRLKTKVMVVSFS